MSSVLVQHRRPFTGLKEDLFNVPQRGRCQRGRGQGGHARRGRAAVQPQIIATITHVSSETEKSKSVYIMTRMSQPQGCLF